MSKHTPGPWEFSGSTMRQHSNNLASTIADHLGDGTDAQYEGNARLIAAAPDLLAALESLLAESEAAWEDLRNTPMSPETFDALRDHLEPFTRDTARAAIAKAKGE